MITFTFTLMFRLACAWASEPDLSAAIAELKLVAALPAVVEAVEARNRSMPAELARLNNSSWTELSVADPIVEKLLENSVSKILRESAKEYVTEVFLSAADGTKVAFLSKPTSWSHKGKTKHEDPMRGKIWQGKLEKDSSTGIHQIQISAPVLKGNRPIGSLVFGVSLVKWEQRKK